MIGRSWDDVAERSDRRLIDPRGGDWRDLSGLGLFYKTRGRFEEGRNANQKAFDSGGADVPSVHWDLDICATGAGDLET